MAECLAHGADRLPPKGPAQHASAHHGAHPFPTGADRLPPPKAPAQLPAVSSLLGGADHLSPRTTITTAAFLDSWGIDPTNSMRGGLLNAAGADAGAAAGAAGGAATGAAPATAPAPSRQLFLLQRKKGKHGGGLGKTTGWIHRESLKKEGVNMIGGVSYEKVDDEGLHMKGQANQHSNADCMLIAC